MHVTKQEFVDRVADKSGLSKRDAAEAVDAFLRHDHRRPARTRRGRLHRLREVHDAAARARQGVNPRNPSQKVQIPATTVPKFSAGSQLKQAVKSGAGGDGGGAVAAGRCSSRLTEDSRRATGSRGPLVFPGSSLG